MNTKRAKPEKSVLRALLKKAESIKYVDTDHSPNRGTEKTFAGITLQAYHFYLVILAISTVSLCIALISYFQDWPLKITYLFGVGSIEGAEKVASVLRLPIVLFLVLLTCYMAKRAIETYRSSFDRKFDKARFLRDQKKRNQ